MTALNLIDRILKISLVALLLMPASTAHARVIPMDRRAGADLRASALQAAAALAEDLGAPGATLKVRAVSSVPDGQVVHLQQVSHGLPVLDASASVLSLSGRFVALSGQLRPVPAGFALDRAALLDLAAVRSAVEGSLSDTTVRHGHLAVQPPLLASSPDGARAVWVLDVITHQPLGLFEVLADARTGAVLRKVSAMHDVDGQVFSTNPKAGKLVTASLQGLANKKDRLQGEYAAVSSCSYANSKLSCNEYATPDSKGDFIFKMDEGKYDDPFAEVNAYYHVDNIHRWMKDTFGFKRQGKTGIDVVVNLHSIQGTQKKGMSNAFFGDINGDKVGDLVFGQGNLDFAYDGDVIYHEFTHSAVDETSDLNITIDSLGFNVAPAALNEGFADLFSSFLAGDPVVGDYMKSTGIRNLTGNASCPTFLKGESHNDGMIWGRAVWTFRETLSAADKKVFEDAVYTVMAGLGKNAGFADAALLLTTTVKAKDAAMATKLAAELKTRGVDTCSRIVPLIPGASRSFYIYGLSISPTLKAIPGPLQYKIEVPKTAKSMTLYVQRGYGSGMAAYVRVNKEVGYDYVGPQFDHIKDSVSGSLTLSTDDNTGKLKLIPGATYYVLPLNVGNYTTVGSVSVTIKDEPIQTPDMFAPTPDMGVPPALDSAVAPGTDSLMLPNPADPDQASGSCSVSSDNDATGALSLLFVLGLLVIRRRRR